MTKKTTNSDYHNLHPDWTLFIFEWFFIIYDGDSNSFFYKIDTW